MTNQSFDNLVKQKVTAHEAPVPPGVWEAIVKEKKKKRYPVIWWVTGSVLTLVAAGFVIKYMVDGNHDAIANQQKTIVQKIYTPKEKANTEASAIPVTNVIHGDSLDINNQENKNSVVPLSSQSASTSDVPGVKGDQSSITSVHRSNQDLSISILPLSGTGEKYHVTKSSLQENNLAVSPGPGQHNTVLTGKKNIQTENNRPALSKNADVRYTTYPSQSFIPENPNSDSAITSEKTMMRNRSDYSLLSKQWKDLSISHPAIADNMVKPVTPAIKRLLLRPSRWSVDISIIPFQPIQQKHSLLSLSRTTTGHMHTAEYKPDQVATTLKPALAYSLGVNKRINKHLMIGSGLQYAVIKEHITLSGKETNTAYQVVQRLDSSGPAPVLLTDTVVSITTGTRIINAINSYRLLEIPLLLQYTLIEKPSWSFRMNGGIQLGILTQYHNSINGTLVPEYSSGDHPQNSTAVRVSFFTGVRFTNRLTRRYQVFAAPYLRFSTGNYNTNMIINSKPVHQAGIALGISYKIGR